MDIYGYYHICAINSYLDIVKDQLISLSESGLFNETKKIFISILIRESPNKINHRYPFDIKLIQILDKYLLDKYQIILIDRCELFELETLNIMRKMALNSKNNYHIYYFHSKGVSDRWKDRLEPYKNIQDWRRMMEEVIFWNWKSCIEKIEEGYDVCGCNYKSVKDDNEKNDHFHGNFWWSHSKYVSKLQELDLNSKYTEAENWICKNNPNIFEFFNTKICHYWNPYSPMPDISNFGLPFSRFEKPKETKLSIYPGRKIKVDQTNYLNLSIEYVYTKMYDWFVESGEAVNEKNIQIFNDKFIYIYKYIIVNFDLIRNRLYSIGHHHWTEKLTLFMANLYLLLYYTNNSQANEVAVNFAKLTVEDWSFYYHYYNIKNKIDDKLKHNLNFNENEFRDYRQLNRDEKMKNGYHLVLANDGSYAVGVFNDIIPVVKSALMSIGITPTSGNKFENKKINILMAGQLSTYNYFPKDTIILNMEQLDNKSDIPEHREKITKYINHLSKYDIIDYDPFNIDLIKKKFSKQCGILSFGYTDDLHFIKEYNENEKDIDVLFLGFDNPKRKYIREELLKYNINCIFKTGVFGNDRINLLKRSKIVLNIPGHGDLFQISRIGFLLNNNCFVISEKTSCYHFYNHLEMGIVYANYDDFILTVIEYISKPNERKKISEIGHSLYKLRTPSILLPEKLNP